MSYDYRPDKEIFIECLCGTHAIKIDKYVWDDGDQDIFLSLWVSKWYAKDMSLWERLKLIWKILRHGEYFLDEVELSKEDVIKLKDGLGEMAE